MEKFFNTAGACIPSEHYTVSVEPYFANFQKLIDNKRYFILHAPRQTGKTTLMLHLMEHLNQQGNYIALYVNVEAAQAWRNQITEVNQTIVNQLKRNAKIYLPSEFQPSPQCFEETLNEFSHVLTNWCLELPKSLVLK